MQNEVIEKKEKKPLSKKRIVVIVAIALVAVLLLVPIASQCVIALFNGEFYEQDGFLQNTHVYIENAYVEDGVLHYTIVNDTIMGLYYASEPPVEEYVDGEWVICKPEGLPPLLGNKGDPHDRTPKPTVPAFGKVELTRELADYQSDKGTYRIGHDIYPASSFITHCLGYLIPLVHHDTFRIFSVVATYEIPAAS